MTNLLDLARPRPSRKNEFYDASRIIPPEKIARKIRSRCDVVGGCLVFTGAKNDAGYGQIWNGFRLIYTHRALYEFEAGPIPPGYQLDHLCRNPSCCNPSHLEPVTPKENTRRGIISEVNRRRSALITYCPQGHEYSKENTYVSRMGKRQCKECTRIRNRKNRQRRKAYRAF